MPLRAGFAMNKLHSDRGAILVHTAFALLALMAFSGFAVDYGMFWVARNQAQNAADAAALAGALARITDDASNPPASKTSGKVYDVVATTAAWNRVWGQSPPVTLDWTCPDDGTTNCVVVDAYRDGTQGSNAMPTFFLQLAGIKSQRTTAHAVAKVLSANGFKGCIRPWFAIDEYNDLNGDDKFDAGDTYTAPGYQLPRDLGIPVTFHDNTSPSGYGQIDVGQSNSGSALGDAITHCSTDLQQIVLGVPIGTDPGGKVGPERSGVQQLFDWDPSAQWDQSTGTVIDSCATTGCACDGPCPNGPNVSPRVVVAPVCSPLEATCAAGGARTRRSRRRTFWPFSSPVLRRETATISRFRPCSSARPTGSSRDRRLTARTRSSRLSASFDERARDHDAPPFAPRAMWIVASVEGVVLWLARGELRA